MKKTLITIIALIAFTVAKAQTTDTLKSLTTDTVVFSLAAQEPQFPGGINAFYKYLGMTIHYPAGAKVKKTQGKVFVTFIVEKDGSLSNMKIAVGVSSDIDAEALRVMKGSPKWIPGTQNGKIVRVFYTMPITFSLSDD